MDRRRSKRLGLGGARVEKRRFAPQGSSTFLLGFRQEEYNALHAGGRGGHMLCAGGVRCVLLCVLEAVEGVLCLLDVCWR